MVCKLHCTVRMQVTRFNFAYWSVEILLCYAPLCSSHLAEGNHIERVNSSENFWCLKKRLRKVGGASGILTACSNFRNFLPLCGASSTLHLRMRTSSLSLLSFHSTLFSTFWKPKSLLTLLHWVLMPSLVFTVFNTTRGRALSLCRGQQPTRLLYWDPSKGTLYAWRAVITPRTPGQTNPPSSFQVLISFQANMANPFSLVL